MAVFEVWAWVDMSMDWEFVCFVCLCVPQRLFQDLGGEGESRPAHPPLGGLGGGARETNFWGQF